LPRATVIENQRGRIFDALAAVAARKGYAEVTVQDVISRAGVSRRTFYDLFPGKEACFLAAFDTIALRVFRAVDTAYRDGEDTAWPDRLGAGLRALTNLYASEPSLARLAMVDVMGAGPEALSRRDATLRHFTVFLEGGRNELPDGVHSPDLLARAVVGGMWEAVYAYVRDGHAEHLGELMPDLLYCALLPYLGHRRALAAITESEPTR
jgi:AcrR family transcriptional regulator